MIRVTNVCPKSYFKNIPWYRYNVRRKFKYDSDHAIPMEANSVSSGDSGERLDINHAKGLYVSFFAYTFDILSFIALTFVSIPVSKAIYPNANSGISLIIFWGGFAAGSLTRPLGGAFFGKDTDAHGRKRALYINITGAAVFTALLAATPTYASVGLLSPIIFIGLRLIGGVFIGGLIAGGLVFGPENFPERLRGFMTGFAESGGSWAHVIGAAWLLMVSVVFVGASYFTLGWRFMFLVTLVPILIILPVLYKTPESNIYRLAKKKRQTTDTPLKKLALEKSAIRSTFLLALIMSIGLLGYDNMTENFFPTFLIAFNHTPHTLLAEIVLIGALAGVVGSIFGGTISQRTGRKPLAIVGGVILVAISYLYIHLGTLPGDAYYALLLTLMPLYFFSSLSKADFSLYLNEAFPTSVRGSALGLNWNLGYGIAGIWPILVSAVIAIYGTKVYPDVSAITIALLGILYTVGTLLSKETRGNISREKKSLNE
jgi:MHS family proline/betaine transporter-like MFS transporter